MLDKLWLAQALRYHRKRQFEKALHYMRKGRHAIRSVENHLIFAELLEDAGHLEEALVHLKQVAAQTGEGRVYERRAHILRTLDRLEEAIRDLTNALEAGHDHYLVWYTRGLAYKALGKYEDAFRDLKESIRREDPQSATSTFYELGMAYYHSGNPAQAVSCLKESVSHPERAIPVYYYMLARCLDMTERTKEALEAILQGIELANRYAAEEDGGYALFDAETNYSYGAFQIFQEQIRDTYSFRWLLADIYLKLGMYEQGTAAATEGLDLYPDTPDLYIKRAELYAAWGKHEPAKEDLETAIRLAPDEPRPYLDLARLYRKEEAEEKAAVVITLLYRRLPESPLVCFWMADSYHRLGQYEEALRVNDRLLEIEQDDPDNYTQRANILMEMHDLPAAEQALAESLKLRDHAEIRSKRAYALYLQGRNEEAMLELQQAVALDPGFEQNPTYMTASGHIYKEMGLLDLAIDAYTRSIETNPNSPRLYEFRAGCYLDSGEFAKGLSDCTRGLEADPAYAGLYSLRSGIYQALKDHPSAIADVLKYLEFQPGHPGAYYRLGQLYFEEHEEEEALEAFDRVLEVVPEHADSYLYKAHIFFRQFENEAAAGSIVNWSLHLDKEMGAADKISAIQALDGFDESVLERAVERLTETYGHQMYLS